MKTLALLVTIAAVSVVQSGGGSITGSWTAQFEGRTFLTLELKTVDGTITGGMRVGSMEFNKQGAIRRSYRATWTARSSRRSAFRP